MSIWENKPEGRVCATCGHSVLDTMNRHSNENRMRVCHEIRPVMRADWENAMRDIAAEAAERQHEAR